MESRFSRRRKAMADINVTPLVDVMLVLLIVFMVAAPMMTQGLEVDLPEATTSSLPQTEDPLVVTIKRDGLIYFRKAPVSDAALLAELRGMSEEQKKRPIYLHADRTVPYGAVMAALGTMHRAGFEKPCMVTLQPKEGGN